MIELEVIGIPQPQGNKTGIVGKDGRVHMVEGRRGPARRAFKDWREGVSVEAKSFRARNHMTTIDDPVDVWVHLLLPRPPSAPKRRLFPHTRPDVDKLVRAVLDAITGALITNDSRVVTLFVSKRYAIGEVPPGMSLAIYPAGALALTVNTNTEGAAS